jgi:hypothetical protein
MSGYTGLPCIEGSSAVPRGCGWGEQMFQSLADSMPSIMDEQKVRVHSASTGHVSCAHCRTHMLRGTSPHVVISPMRPVARRPMRLAQRRFVDGPSRLPTCRLWLRQSDTNGVRAKRRGGERVKQSGERAQRYWTACGGETAAARDAPRVTDQHKSGNAGSLARKA